MTEEALRLIDTTALGGRLIDLPHVASRVFGTPIAMLPSKLEAILGASARYAGPTQDRAELDVSPDGIATISVEGSLVRRGGFASASGQSTYESIASEVDAAAANPAVRGVLLAIDSPGGEVAGLFDLVSKVQALCEAKPVYAVADEEAYSAAYAIASAADKIYVARTGGVGSIGIVALHVDQSGSDAKRGLSYTFVHAGAKKVDGHGHAPLTPRAHGDLQTEVDRLGEIFAETVAANRDLSPAEVKATEAGVFMGPAAVDAGLADEVGTLEDAATGLRAELDTRRMNMSMRKMLGLAPEASDESVLQAVQGKLAELSAVKALVAGHEAERAKLSARLAELDAARASDLHERSAERVNVLLERGANVGEHLAQEDRADVIAALESSNERERKLGESLLSGFKARVESAEKARGGAGGTLRVQTQGAKVDAEAEATREAMLREQGFDEIVKDAQGRVLLDKCSTPEGRKKRGAVSAAK
jgi:signal peptide peptidase SppA